MLYFGVISGFISAFFLGGFLMLSLFISGYFGLYFGPFLTVLAFISGVISDAVVISGDKTEPCCRFETFFYIWLFLVLKKGSSISLFFC